jgi:hypothetical protein
MRPGRHGANVFQLDPRRRRQGLHVFIADRGLVALPVGLVFDDEWMGRNLAHIHGRVRWAGFVHFQAGGQGMRERGRSSGHE